MHIQCPSCQANYDVSGRPGGTMFTCHCGETFGFPRPAPAPLSLQCPGCGAGADPGDPRCRYCDKPLKSVCCPNCYTLMFEGGKHCRHCGTRVVAPALAVHRGGGTALPCPRCSVGLTANLIDNHLFDRCDRCGGIWLHHLAIQGVLTQKPRKQTVQAWLQSLPPPADEAQTGRMAAPCPDCENEMEQHRMPKSKQMVVDVCGMHGVWFDHREIRAIVGEPAVARRRRSRRHYGRIKRRGEIASFLDDADDWWPWKALEDLLEFLEDLFD